MRNSDAKGWNKFRRLEKHPRLTSKVKEKIRVERDRLTIKLGLLTTLLTKPTKEG